MSDKSLQDVVSGSGRSIRRVPVSNTRKSRPKKPFDENGSVGRSTTFSGGRPGGPRKKSRFGIWVVAIISIIILFLVVSVFSAGVKVKVTPKHEDVSLSGTFTAFKEPQSGELKFNLMTVNREFSEEVVATNEEFVEEKASGKIIVYNNYSTGGQKLIANTRFETPDGLIFRIKDPVTVPGKKTVGGEAVPGSIEVTVYADQAGDSYNIDLSDFTIPGLKGDPRFSKFYARSKTPMTGGVKGNIKKASPEDLARVSSGLDEKLRVEILKEANSVRPEGFVLLEKAYVIRSQTKTSNGTEGNVLVTQTATLVGVIFEEEDLARFIAENTLASYDDLPVKLGNYDNLVISISSDDINNIENTESVSFDISGDTRIVWDFDEELLLQDLKGQSKGNVDNVFIKYPGIKTAEVILRPFWKRSITDNAEKIKLEVVLK